MSTGTLAVLNVGAGDLRVSFTDEKDQAQAKKMVEDLLKAGYTLVVEDEDGAHVRVEDFDPETMEYIVAAIDLRTAKGEARQRRRGGTARRRIPAKKAKAKAVAPTAGG